MKASISIIVPIYNQAQFLGECLDSILAQTRRDIEVICVDDGSTDASPEILRQYATADARVRVVRQENQGPGLARNHGLDLATGEWIAFMDPDDRYPNDKTLATMLANAIANGVDICGGSLRRIVDGQREGLTKRMESGYLFDADGIVKYADYQFDYGYWRFLYRRDFLNRHGLRFPDYRRFQDPPFMVRAFALAESFYAMRAPTYVYRCETDKRLTWDERRALGFYSGIRDVVRLSTQFGFARLFDQSVKRLCTPWAIEAARVNLRQPSVCRLVTELVREIEKSPLNEGGSPFPEGGVFHSIAWTTEHDVKPRVSVVIPVYNVEKYLADCLDSVLAQAYENIEVICVNDGSTDGSRDILDRYPNVKIIDQENRGLGAARNAGLDASSGQYVYFLDSDDKIVSEAIYCLVALAEEKQLDQIVFEGEPFSDDSDVEDKVLECARQYQAIDPSLCGVVMPGPEFLTRALTYNFPVTQQLRFFRREFLLRHQLRYPEGILHEDNGIAWISAYLSERIYALKQRFFLRRVRAGSIMHSPENLTHRADGYLKTIEMVLAFKPFWTTTPELRRNVLQYCIGPLAANASQLSGNDWWWNPPIPARVVGKRPHPHPGSPRRPQEHPVVSPLRATLADFAAGNVLRTLPVYLLPWGVVLAYKKTHDRPMLQHTVFTKRFRWLKYALPYGFIRYWTYRKFGEC